MPEISANSGVELSEELREKQGVREAKIRSLYANLPATSAATLLNALFLSGGLWTILDHWILVTWFSLNLLTIFLRLYSYYRFRMVLWTPEASARWCRIFHAGLLLAGILWGGGGFWFFPPHSLLHQTFILLVLGGMVVGALAANMSSFWGSNIYAWLLIIPAGARCALQGTGSHLAISGMIMVFLLLMYLVSRKIYATMDSSFRLRYKNIGLIEHLTREQVKSTQLVDSLQNEVNQRVRVEGELRKSEDLFRTLTETTSSAIFIVQDDVIQYVNKSGEDMVNYTKEEMKNIPAWNLVHPGYRKLVAGRGVSRLEGLMDLPNRYEFLLCGKNGKEIWVDYTGTQIEYKGRPALLGTVVDITERKAVQAKLHEMATTDALTELNNRRSFLDLAKQDIRRAKRYGRKVSLIMFDADHFKEINDTCGHDVGDAALRHLAQVSAEMVREIDILGRIGGEEFAILMPETGVEQAILAADRLRGAIAESRVPIELLDGGELHVTVSVGVAELGPDDDLTELMKLADNALYRAKSVGRNRVEVEPPLDGAR